MAKTDLRQWVHENRERYVTFTIEEIADMARVHGFSEDEVKEWLAETRWSRQVA